MITMDTIARTLTNAYERVFGNPIHADLVRIIPAADMDDRKGNPTEAVEFAEFSVYETETDETDIRGVPVRKIAIDTARYHYSHVSGWDGDVVEVGLYDGWAAATAALMGIIAERRTMEYLESFEGYDDNVDEGYDDNADADPGDMDGDLASGLASAGMGTDEDYEHGTPDEGWDEF